MTALLIASLLTGQVHVDTVVRLAFKPGHIVYVGSTNRLLAFSAANESLYVFNCGDYSIDKVIPLNGYFNAGVYWAYNWQRDKYYMVTITPGELMVFDPASDSLIRRLPIDCDRRPCYAAEHDRVYVCDDTVMRVLDCGTDSFVGSVPHGTYTPWGAVSWDSVGDKLYATAYNAPTEDMLLAYSCANDSPVATVSTGIFRPTVLAYYPPLHKAYLGSDWSTDKVVSYDCEHDSVIRELAVNYQGHSYGFAGYDAARGKLYLPNAGASRDTLCTIDCRTDSIIKRTPLPYIVLNMAMASRTGRLYLTIPDPTNLVMVLDCEADTLLGPGFETGRGTRFLAYDSVHNRVFVSCRDSSIYVLSDDTAGVAERRLQFPALWDVAISPNPAIGRAVIRWQAPVEANVSLCVYNTAGQLVKVLADGRTKPGTYTNVWSGTDARGRRLANGVYFCTLAAEGQRFSRKVVLTE
ncbi:MAG: T9SS type A sorting domain-containing protein [candidate division WOR-3 bacterium]|nr:T9SS type A sorting domain-containing protein [candidate division WOR-3 bacterium]